MPEDRKTPEEPTPTTAPKAPRKRARPSRTEAARDAYPTPLLDEEEELLEARRAVPPPERGRPLGCKIGVGLSGGGIRSATFCLGFFQGLAAKGGLIRKIDYLSTVSGGGYFGSFLGRLFTRDYIRTPEDVESMLSQDRTVDGTVRGVLRNLRENGRYLSPNGSGDLLLGGAVLFRNWVSLQAVLWAFLLMVFLLVQTVRVALEIPSDGFLTHPAWVAGNVWWSPWLIPPLLVFIVCAFPLGWAYWLVERVGRRLAETEPGAAPADRGERWRPWVPLLLVAALNLGLLAHAAWAAAAGEGVAPAAVAVPAALLVVTLLTPLWWWWAIRSQRRRFEVEIEEERREMERLTGEWEVPPQFRQSRSGPSASQESSRKTKKELFHDAALRGLLSRWLMKALLWTGGLSALAVVDSLGQTLYLVGAHPEVTVLSWIGAIFAGLTALSGFARRLAVKLASDPEGGRVKLPADVLATVAGLLVALFLLVTLNAASHAVAWTGPPAETATERLTRTVPAGVMAKLFAEEEGAVVTAEARVPGGRPLTVEVSVEARAGMKPPPEGLVPGERDSWPWLLPSGGGLLFTLALSWAFGRIWPFVNRSSHQPLYSSRLTRAYLGASNLQRLGRAPKSVTQSIPGDDVDLATYWPPPSQKAAPIHLINVTVNETVDGRSQVEQKDRKGMGLALGPCGLSVGVRHHIVAPFGVEIDPDRARIFPEGDGAFRVFEYPKTDFRGEVLPLGEWVGISGAAFSTGLGARTSLGLSLLLGLANVRLGYWWDSGVDPRDREAVARRAARRRQGGDDRRRPRLSWPGAPFAVQRFLKDELLARFPGTARRHWYLSDGGHFENMGGYELIRRRLPLIVVIDAEADPDYTYGGLANLVRKARLDFGAEIEFMSPEEIDRELPPEVRCHVGSLEQLRRGRWKRSRKDADDEGKRLRPEADFDGDDRTGRCLVHAALARVIYTDSETETHHPTESRLLYVKPSLFGDDPEDVLDYHRQNPDFPQQTTADQFFDEAQWESYRRLGQHIAEKVFRSEKEGKADWERVRKPGNVGTRPETEEERDERVRPLWNLGRLECPPEAVTRPKKRP